MGDEERDRVIRWLDESRHFIGRVMPRLIEEREILRRRLDGVETERDRLRADLDHIRGERAGLGETLDAFSSLVAQLQAPLADLRRRLERLAPAGSARPAAPAAPVAARPARPTAAPVVTRTVLVVDDDSPVRAVTAEILRSAGYAVLEAPSGPAALALARAHLTPIPAMVVDVSMPGMSGPEAAQHLVRLHPETRVLFISGHAQDAASLQPALGGATLLPKPFTPDALVEAVRRIIEPGRVD